MNKLLIALFTGAVALVSVSAMAQAPAPAAKPKPATQPIPSDSTLMPLTKMDTDQAKAARAAAKAKWDAMTPEQKAAMKKELAKKRQADLTALDEYVIRSEGATYNAAAGAAAAKESKALPTPTKQERQADLKKAEDAAAKTGVSKSGVPQQ